MKYLLFAALFVVAVLPDCKKEKIIIKTPEPIDTIAPIDTVQHVIGFGQGSVLRNGAIWDGYYKALYEYNTKLRAAVKIQKKYSSITETAYISDIPLAIGKHYITMTTSLGDFNNGIADALYTMSNYDEGIGTFFPDTTRTDNFIEILHFDTIANEVEGRFQVFMGKNGELPVPGVPDSVFLTEGKFYLKLQ